MTDVRISVIVPVYNAEKYVRDCLDSIRRQTFSKFEVICVDDGSTDSSWEILLEYAEKDSRFQVLRTENKGVSAARNKGVQRARGEYISFLDSDDFFHPQFLEIMLNNLLNGGVEVTSCCYLKVPEDATYGSYDFRISDSVLTRYDSESFLVALVQLDETIRVVVWNKLYTTALVKKIMFDESLRAHEDVLFMLQIAGSSRGIMNNSARLVYHRNTPGSLSKHTNQKWRQSFLKSWVACVQTLNNLPSKEKRLLRRRTMRLLYRDLVKRPVREAKADHQRILAESRDALLTNTRNGRFMERYLSLQDRIVCRLLFAGFFSLVKHLHCSSVCNWGLYLKKRRSTSILGKGATNEM